MFGKLRQKSNLQTSDVAKVEVTQKNSADKPETMSSRFENGSMYSTEKTVPIGDSNSDETIHQPSIGRFSNTVSQSTSKAKKRSFKWLFKLLLALAILAALAISGYEIYHFLTRPISENTPKTDTNVTPPAPTPAPETSEIEKFSSTEFKLSFNYPGDWTVDEAESLLSVTSPTFSLPSSEGGDVDGTISLIIVPTTNDVTDFPTRAVASLSSQKFTYDTPASGQRQESYVSFAGTTTGLSAVYITGDNAYTKGATIPLTDLASVEPIISLHFHSGEEAVSVDPAAWESEENLIAAFDILRSLSIR